MPCQGITTVQLFLEPDVVRLDIGVESGNTFTFVATSDLAAQMAADLAQAAARAMSIDPKKRIIREQGYESLFAPKVALKDYCLDDVTGNVLLSMEDEHGGVYNFLLDRMEAMEFAQQAILLLAHQASDDEYKQ